MRCQNFGPPPGDIITDLHGGGTPANWVPEQWWQGYQLIVPGQGSQDLLRNQDASTKSTYPAVTKNHWRLSCITESTDANGNPITANGQPGDGFVAHAPDGTEYYFNELIYGVAQGASQTTWTATPTSSSIGRQVAFLLITKIEDRFGNTLTYNYDPNGNLTGIAASDGRVLAINYTDSTDTLVQSVTLQPASGAARTWTYAYTQVSSPLYGGATSLQTVTLPDNSQWQYQSEPSIRCHISSTPRAPAIRSAFRATLARLPRPSFTHQV
jgi:YD repeat-containing protein